MIKFSPQAEAVLNWITSGFGSAVVEAVAGAGKTTLLIEAIKRMAGTVLVAMYSKKIQIEFTERLGVIRPGVKVTTMHAAGFGAWLRAAKGVVVNEGKCKELFRAKLNPTEDEEIAKLEAAVLALVSYAKQAALGVEGVARSTRSAWFALIEHFDIDCLEREEEVFTLAMKLMGLSRDACYKEIDFDDMIFAPLYFKARCFQNDWVLIDEAQDTNVARRALALRMLAKGGRLIAVGDRHQAIFGFTGADSNSLDLIATATNAKLFPLSVTYRCPKAVVKTAQQWVSHIQAHPSAPEGVVRRLNSEKEMREQIQAKDAILCRYNAPVMGLVYGFSADGIAAKVEGKNIGEGLKQLAGRWKVKSFDALLKKLEEYEQREVAKWTKKEQPSKAEAVQDKVECLRVIIARTIKMTPGTSEPIRSLYDNIDSIFADSVNGNHIVLTSIHKAKGREWNRVFWAETGMNPNIKQQWEQEQEINLCYVAATRAKQELVFFPAPKKDRKQQKPQ